MHIVELPVKTPDDAIKESARYMKKLFDAYIEAGFTEEQAITLLMGLSENGPD